MQDEAFNNYLDEIPAEIRDAVSELSSSQRWAVFLAILKEDRYFNELRRELGISAEQLDNILRRLVIGGLVFREMASPAEIGDRKKTRYAIAPLGKNLLRGLLEGFLQKETGSSAGKNVHAEYDVQKGTGMALYESGAGYRRLTHTLKEPVKTAPGNGSLRSGAHGKTKKTPLAKKAKKIPS